MTVVGAIDPDAHLEGWPAQALGLDAEGVLAEQVEIPEPAWTRATERPKPKVTPEQRRKRRRR